MKIAGAGDLIRPVPTHHWIAHVRQQSPGEARIGQHADDLDERRPLAGHGRQQSVARRVFEPRPNDAGALWIEELVQQSDETFGYLVLLIFIGTFEKVESNGHLAIGRIDQHHVVDATRGHALEDGLGQFAMRIEDGYASAGEHVLDGQIQNERGLAGAGLAGDVHVSPPIVGRDGN
jgi:hypothetical protein